MSLLRATLSLLNRIALSTCISVFGYFLPAISSVRAVLHKDENGYNQWLSYFLILHLFNVIEPFVDLALNPWLKFAIILWLSLPKYQGASVVYARLIVPCLDRYEGHVDDGIEKAQKEGKRRIITFMSDTGYGLIQKAWGMLRAAKDGSLFADVVAKDEKKREKAEEEEEAKKSPRRKSRNIIASLSSSLKDSDAVDMDNEDYILDFLELLEKGLFVFASVKNTSSPDDDTSSPDIGPQLRVFSYEKDDNAFAISHVDKNDFFLLPVSDIDDVDEVGAQGICIRLGSGEEAEVVLSGAEDRETLLGGLSSSLAYLRGRKDPSCRMVAV